MEIRLVKTKTWIGLNFRTLANYRSIISSITCCRSISRPIIPKRGEKDFEPTIHGGSGLQRHVLDRKRRAMLDALGVERNTSRQVQLNTVSGSVAYLPIPFSVNQ